MDKEYLIKKSSEITLNVTNGKVDSFREIDETTKTVRVYENGVIGVAGSLGEVDLKTIEKQAIKKLSDGIPYNSTLSAGVKKSIENSVPAINKSVLINSVKRLAKKVANECPGFLINGKGQYSENSGSYSNSANTELSFKNSNFNVFFQVKDKKSSNIADLYYSANVGRYGKSVENKIVADLKTLHDNFFTEKITLPDGEYPMIFESYDIFGLILKDFIAEYYVSGGSLLSDKAGTKVFNENLNLSVDRNPKTNRLSAFYDDEGEISKNYRSVLIEKGILKGILTTKNSAHTFGLPLSKTAGGEYDGVPSLSVPGLFLQATAPDLKTLLGDKKAIWVAISSGGDITTDGVIGLPVMLAFLVENGEIKGRISNFNASGNIFEILGNKFVGVSKKNLMSAVENEMLVVNMQLIND